MMYLLDTNVLIRFANRTSPLVIERISAASPETLFLCSIVKAELLFGAYNSAYPDQNVQGFKRLFTLFPSLPFDDSCVESYGRIRAYFKRRGTPIGGNDLFVAAIALSHNLALITANTREFSRVPELRFENWEV